MTILSLAWLCVAVIVIPALCLLGWIVVEIVKEKRRK